MVSIPNCVNSCSAFTIQQLFFSRKILRPDEIAMFLRCSLKANRINEVQTMLNYYADKHECVDESEITLLLMEEVSILKE